MNRWRKLAETAMDYPHCLAGTVFVGLLLGMCAMSTNPDLKGPAGIGLVFASLFLVFGVPVAWLLLWKTSTKSKRTPTYTRDDVQRMIARLKQERDTWDTTSMSRAALSITRNAKRKKKKRKRGQPRDVLHQDMLATIRGSGNQISEAIFLEAGRYKVRYEIERSTNNLQIALIDALENDPRLLVNKQHLTSGSKTFTVHTNGSYRFAAKAKSGTSWKLTIEPL